MAKKILVIYATRYGSTKDIAEKIAGYLNEKGYQADSENFSAIKSTEGYDAVIAGSAIQMGKWLPEAREFIQAHNADLNKVPLFVFSCGITLHEPDENEVRKALFATDEIKLYVDPKETGLFAGKLDTGILTDPDRQIITLAKPECGDFRNYRKISKWVDKLDSDYLKKL
ncbi:menaquinone-dependent protoporphyrinogen oxidase [Methanomicrobium sp. W14]|uniref:flavodoxin domain-containing protein n=1 Tax=Methanomicrobium sp. W14 TaxID=2817839 RepID=UPI001AE8292F|nr:flavodoxin domain-containing protein [Methanomicrobium sp. W14]MBP2132922.1 menaquinone-dependent protoporphyrinogen oxidase [Methanomicrobium sp. W14]